MQSQAIAHIDLAALKHNFLRVKQLAPNSRVMSVIKARAYGHGAIQAAEALVDSDAFAVARLEEGIELRLAGIVQPIVVLEGVMTNEELQAAADYSLSPVFHHVSQLELLLSTDLNKALSFCWLMVETGMHRLGFPQEQLSDALEILNISPNIIGEVGLMSHFANSDIIGDPRNQQQLDVLKQCSDAYKLPTSMANSAAIFSLAESHGGWVRPGIMLYGASPFSDQTADDLDLKPVMRLTSVITAIQDLKAGDEVGYGGDWQANQRCRVGIVSIGYGDGYSRQLSNTGAVIIHNTKVAVVGRISMDMIIIDLSDVAANVDIGDEVILWGDAQLSVDEIAQQANTISYELLCHLNERVKRIYHYGEN